VAQIILGDITAGAHIQAIDDSRAGTSQLCSIGTFLKNLSQAMNKEDFHAATTSAAPNLPSLPIYNQLHYLRPLFNKFKRDVLMALFTCLIFIVAMDTYGQNSSYFAESRLACAQGLGEQGVDRARAMGIQVGIADMCVAALKWAATNGRLLDIYISSTGPGGARLLINHLTDSAELSTGQFRPGSLPLEMWKNHELTPSLAFDAGFARSFLEKQKGPSGSISSGELKHRTEACLNLTESLSACVNAGRIQGTLAYQISDSFSNNSTTPASKSESQGPDRAQTAAAIDRKFQNWSQSWRLDHYSSGSVQITDMNCSEQCKASGQFSFTRFGALHTIAFVAFLSSGGDGKYSLGRLCYKDDTTGTLDCTD